MHKIENCHKPSIIEFLKKETHNISFLTIFNIDEEMLTETQCDMDSILGSDLYFSDDCWLTDLSELAEKTYKNKKVTIYEIKFPIFDKLYASLSILGVKNKKDFEGYLILKKITLEEEGYPKNFIHEDWKLV